MARSKRFPFYCYESSWQANACSIQHYLLNCLLVTICLYFLMQKEQKSKKANLILSTQPTMQQTTQLSQQQEITEILVIKPLRSTKNQFQMRQKFFRSQKHQEGGNRKYSLSLDQLQKEKEQLMESIQILKTGAISAIAQKEDKLSRLKEVASNQKKQEMQVYQQIIKQTLSSQRQLQTSLSQLHQQLHQQRKSLTSILEEKQARIQQLQSLVRNMRNYIDELQGNEDQLVAELKILEDKVYSLSKELQMHTIEVVIQEQAQKVKLSDIRSHHKRTSSVSSNIPFCKSSTDLFDALHTSELSISMQRQYTQKIQEMMQRHLEEISEIKQFYQSKISNIRNIYNAYIFEQFQNKSLEEDIEKTEAKINEQGSIIEKYMSRCQSSSDIYLGKEKAEVIEKISQPSVHILKEEIHFAHEYSPQKNQKNSGQASSQLTKEYFQNPFRFVKQKSMQSLKSMGLLKIVHETGKEKVAKNEIQEPKTNELEEKNTYSVWQKPILFAAGMISGISISSIVNVALKKKQIKSMLKYLPF